MNLKKIKRFYYYVITIILIFFCVSILLNNYVKGFNSKISKVTKIYFKKEIYNSLNSISKEALSPNIDDLFIIYKNNEGEILYVDYNMHNTYQLLDKITRKIKDNLEKNEYPNDGIVLKLPLFIESNNALISNLGPKITIKINYIDSILTNVYSKITNYGLNNALIEAYVKITINGKIMTPVSNYEEKIDYDMLISSRVINGRIPLYYGGYITTSSKIFDIPIKS